MGADFLFASIPHAEITPEREQELIDVIDALKETDEDSDVEWLRECVFGDDKELEDIKDSLKFYIKVLNKILECRSVGLGRWTPMVYDVVLTGGESWGDGPTDTFDDITALSSCPEIEAKLLKWAREDFAKKEKEK